VDARDREILDAAHGAAIRPVRGELTGRGRIRCAAASTRHRPALFSGASLQGRPRSAGGWRARRVPFRVAGPAETAISGLSWRDSRRRSDFSCWNSSPQSISTRTSGNCGPLELPYPRGSAAPILESAGAHRPGHRSRPSTRISRVRTPVQAAFPRLARDDGCRIKRWSKSATPGWYSPLPQRRTVHFIYNRAWPSTATRCAPKTTRCARRDGGVVYQNPPPRLPNWSGATCTRHTRSISYRPPRGAGEAWLAFMMNGSTGAAGL